MISSGLGRFQPVIRENSVNERLPTQTTAELINLRDIADQVRGVADEVDGIADDAQPEADGNKPAYLRLDFDANLAEHMDPLAQIGRAHV